ncbi:MAG: hypothetical protein H6747_04555 [Deltaproteobacteria bacterium]|nr:hypothetical protein [Deltaproteobacteria bacterium]
MASSSKTFLLASTLLLAGCGTAGGGGGGGFATFSAGSACAAGPGVEVCGVVGSNSARLRCDSGIWVAIKACPAGCEVLVGGLTGCVGADAGGGGGATVDSSSGGDSGSTLDSAATEDSAGDAPIAPSDAASDAALTDVTLADADAGGGAADAGTTADSGATDVWNADGIGSDAAPDGNSTSDVGFDAGGGTCYGYCGGAGSNNNCYCDSACEQYGDCCSDFKAACGSTADAGPPDAWPNDAGGSDVAQDVSGDTSAPLACVPSCTPGSYCVAGSCVVPNCALPAPNSLAGVQRLTSFALMSESKGCDVDLDGTADNVMGKMVGLYAQLNDGIADAIKGGKDVGFLVPAGWNTAGTQFQLAMTAGDWNGSTATLNVTTWDLQGSGTCALAKPMQATSSKGNLDAVGKQFLAPFVLFVGLFGSPFQMTASGEASLFGDVPASGPWTQTSNGAFCGAVPNAALNAWIDSIPDELLAETGFDKATIKGLMSSLLKPDIDLDGDGTKESISFAYSFTSELVAVSGYK